MKQCVQDMAREIDKDNSNTAVCYFMFQDEPKQTKREVSDPGSELFVAALDSTSEKKCIHITAASILAA